MLEAAFRRSGVLRVNSIADLFYMAEVLAKQPRPKGPRLTILTNAGGPGVLATDALITGGGELAEISPETMEALNELPARRLEPQQPGRHPRRRQRRSATPRRSRSPPRTRTATACWSSSRRRP